MNRGAARALQVMSAVWLSGCGTAFNLNVPSSPCKPYGGVVHSTIFAKDCALSTLRWDDPFLVMVGCMLGPCALIDIPLSAIADTITLPRTLPREEEAPDHTHEDGENRRDGKLSREVKKE